jgi:membrane-bound serine protease (ClpP class)
VLLLLALLLALLWLPSPWGFLVVIGAAIVEVLEVWFWIWYTRRRRSVVGAEALVGEVGIAAGRLDPRGQVRIVGEIWQARSDEVATAGERVVVERVEPDLTLVVRPEQGKSPE